MPSPALLARLLSASLLLAPIAAFACESRQCTCQPARRAGAWWIFESSNFQVCSLNSADEAQRISAHCEASRRNLMEFWQLGGASTSWSPKCQIILHPNAKSYTLAVGRGVGASFGSSLVRPARGDVTLRRIDLRADVDGFLTEALPHELCHLLIADVFREQPAPLWCEEGVAILADTQRKQLLHRRDLANGVTQGLHFRTAELLSLNQYPLDRVSVFYGQCASLTQLLLDRGSPKVLLRFASRCQLVGANQALKECYGIAGTPELDRLWVGYAKTEPPASKLRKSKAAVVSYGNRQEVGWRPGS